MVAASTKVSPDSELSSLQALMRASYPRPSVNRPLILAEASYSSELVLQSRLPWPMKRCPTAMMSSLVTSNAGSALRADTLIASSRLSLGATEKTPIDGA